MSTFPRMHVSYYVSNIEETVKFYNQFFEQEASKIEPGYAKYILANPSLVISFVERSDKLKSNFGHLGFQVDSEETLNQKMEMMKQKGLKIREEIGTKCCYALQDKFWVSDPDGYQWEVYHFHKDVSFNDPHYEIKKSNEDTMAFDLSASVSTSNHCNSSDGCC